MVLFVVVRGVIARYLQVISVMDYSWKMMHMVHSRQLIAQFQIDTICEISIYSVLWIVLLLQLHVFLCSNQYI